jgi:hypothetical protein
LNFISSSWARNWMMARGESTGSGEWIKRNSETTNKFLKNIKLILVFRAHLMMHS